MERATGRWISRAESSSAPALAVVLLTGVLARLILVALTTTPTDSINHLYPGYTDGEEYADVAHSLVDHGVFGYAGRASAFRPPAYPWLMALSFLCFGGSFTPIRLLQIALFV